MVGETSNQSPPCTPILLCPFPQGLPWPARPGCIAGCIAALLSRAAVHREGPFAGVTALGLADTLFVQKPHLVVEGGTARRPEQGEAPARQVPRVSAQDTLNYKLICYENHRVVGTWYLVGTWSLFIEPEEWGKGGA